MLASPVCCTVLRRVELGRAVATGGSWSSNNGVVCCQVRAAHYMACYRAG